MQRGQSKQSGRTLELLSCENGLGSWVQVSTSHLSLESKNHLQNEDSDLLFHVLPVKLEKQSTDVLSELIKSKHLSI